MWRGRKAQPRKRLTDELRAWVGEQLSPIAKPDEIRLTDNLPKTRSGKIMRRLLRAVARGEEITQDMSTLENPAILEQLRGSAPAAVPARALLRTKTANKSAKKAAKKKAKRVNKKSAAKSAKKPAKIAAKAAKRVRPRAPSARRKK